MKNNESFNYLVPDHLLNIFLEHCGSFAKNYFGDEYSEYKTYEQMCCDSGKEWKEFAKKRIIYLSNKKLLFKEYPGHCVECFITLDDDEIICGPCQDECDGRWDHLRQIKDEVE